jgi:polyhydroxybutyrate depolymerase
MQHGASGFSTLTATGRAPAAADRAFRLAVAACTREPARMRARAYDSNRSRRGAPSWALVVLLCAGIAGIVTPARAGTFLESETLPHGGVTRWYDLYVPDGVDGGAPVPLLLVLHGGTLSNDGPRAGQGLRLRALADDERFVIAFPNGTYSENGQSGPSGSFNWNDCRSDAGAAETGADDTGFIADLIDAIAARYPIDAQRVYVAGASNGGMMAYRLALELSDRIAAVAAAIANQPANSECVDAPSEPLSILIMDGTADPIMPWAGGSVAGRGLVLSAEATRDFWRERLGTGPTPQHTDFPDLDPNDVGTVTSDRYTGGRNGSEVLFYTLNGSGHAPPSIAYPSLPAQNHDIETYDEFWRFLSAHRRSGAASRSSGIQVTPDGRQTLVSKDVGDERWAIGYEAASGTLTGNVFRTDGQAPTFVACQRTSVPTADPLLFACAAADGCPAAPCTPERWTDLGAVSLPARFVASAAGD